MRWRAREGTGMRGQVSPIRFPGLGHRTPKGGRFCVLTAIHGEEYQADKIHRGKCSSLGELMFNRGPMLFAFATKATRAARATVPIPMIALSIVNRSILPSAGSIESEMSMEMGSETRFCFTSPTAIVLLRSLLVGEPVFPTRRCP